MEKFLDEDPEFVAEVFFFDNLVIPFDQTFSLICSSLVSFAAKYLSLIVLIIVLDFVSA